MTKRYTPIDLKGLKTYPLGERKSKVSVSDFASPWTAGKGIDSFFKRLPNILAGEDLRSVITAVASAYRREKTVMMAMGAHVIKVGLSPVIIDLMERGVISAIAMNGAGIIHDLELAMTGQTSEDVAASLGEGMFGMARETGEFLSEAIRRTEPEDLGLGESVGKSIIEQRLPLREQSILAAGARLGLPVTIHVAMGTDIIHMHPAFDPRSAGGASHRDFRTFASVVATLNGGVYLNVGSAVILPEVFLKAVTLVRNLGHDIGDFTTVNLDFIQHYRPLTNVVRRPTSQGGNGYSLVGHHELMIPLIAAGVIEAISRTDGG